MQHPLELVPNPYRKWFFYVFLFLTAILFVAFRSLEKDMKPNGVVRFELAGNPSEAKDIVSSWSQQGKLNAAFGLGLDYLFMPTYALALAFGALLATQRHSGPIKSLGALAGYGAFVAALFDAVENFALWWVLLGAYESGYPAIAAVCAYIKFGLLIFGLLVCIAGALLPKR